MAIAETHPPKSLLTTLFHPVAISLQSFKVLLQIVLSKTINHRDMHWTNLLKLALLFTARNWLFLVLFVLSTLFKLMLKLLSSLNLFNRFSNVRYYDWSFSYFYILYFSFFIFRRSYYFYAVLYIFLFAIILFSKDFYWVYYNLFRLKINVKVNLL